MKALFDQNLLPRVLAGSSVGSIGEHVACTLASRMFQCLRLHSKQICACLLAAVLLSTAALVAEPFAGSDYGYVSADATVCANSGINNCDAQ